MGRGVIEVPFNEVVTLVKDIHNNHIWDKFIVVSLWRWNKSMWCVSTQRLDYASTILGIVGAPEHPGILGILSWSGGQNIENLQCPLTKCTVASFPVTSFLCLQHESSLEDYIQLSIMLEYNHWEKRKS